MASQDQQGQFELARLADSGGTSLGLNAVEVTLSIRIKARIRI